MAVNDSQLQCRMISVARATIVGLRLFTCHPTDMLRGG
jgi:hypothetical protein